MGEDKKIWYLCDGKKPDCKKTFCYKNTNEDPCRHTRDIEHAVSFEKKETSGRISYWETAAISELPQPTKESRNKFCYKIKNIFYSIFETIFHVNNS